MRNLKKVLALVLALVMSLSLVTIANAADFSDNADIDYSEAVDVMVAAGIIDGVGNNSFDPNGTLTREQAAKLITYMLLGENSEKLGVESSSFKDVAVTRWSAPAIEYCATMGIIDGAGDGNFYPAGKLTGFAFAKMLLTALGYDSATEKFVGAGWTIPVATIGMEVGLDNGLERTFGNAEITRQEAAQMALNAIKAPLVHYPNKGNTVSVNGVVVDFTSQQYEYITTTIARQQTISDQKLSNSDDYTIEFGEKYLPKLELRRETDAFGRPAYTWAYDKKEIGNYLDDTDLVAEFTTKVTGKDLYDAITKNVMEHLYGDVVTVTIDGEDNHAKNSAVFTEDDITRTGTDTLGATEKGVLTQVFVRNVNNNDKTLYDVDIVIINTYLAIASEDYDSKNGEVDLDVYGLHNKESKSSPEFIKDETKDTTATVEDENIDVSDVKENDMFLVAVAAGPGSFTGLRIGVATAKGLAWVGEKPCAPCSTLESMAWPLAHLEGKLIVCAMDARRKQVYNALFRARGEELERLSPDRAISLAELGEELKSFPAEKIVVGDGAILCYNTLRAELPNLEPAPVHLRMQSALGVVWAAEELLASGGLVSGGELAPVYHRLSQAERERLEREQNTKYTIEGDRTHV